MGCMENLERRNLLKQIIFCKYDHMQETESQLATNQCPSKLTLSDTLVF